ncbi:MAG: FtsW/RodA/SpoVE family cell cycle protein [Hyphomicrobiaceae bacterium]
MSLSRADRSVLTAWWFTVDRVQLYAICALVGIGLVVSLAASPSVAINKDLPPFYFVQRHVVFAIAGMAIIFLLSLQSPRTVRRTALAIYIIALAGLIAVQFVGVEVNGARRWIRIAGGSIQPSEFIKPAFVVLVAWALSEAKRRQDMPALPIALAIYTALVSLLLVQPDVGQSVLVTLVWGALFVLAGLSLLWVIAFVLITVGGLVWAYVALDYVRNRIDQFASPMLDERSQMGLAYQSFVQGGFLGRGPGEGFIKARLPDAHADFIFAVIAEEYGALACLGLVMLFAFIVVRGFIKALLEHDSANRLAIAGLALMFGLQALINMSVNVGLLPAKGMTLPMISAGGSSMLGISITLGMLLALSRRRPQSFGSELPPMPPPFRDPFTIGAGRQE